MAYLQYRFLFRSQDEETVEIFIARLAESGFEGFWQGENELITYAEETAIVTGNLQVILGDPVFLTLGIDMQIELLAEKNWNEEWEKSYPPVIIENICTIVAPFHPRPSQGLSLLIEPKMSFGTGHHQSTRLMIRQIHSLDIRDLYVLDMGCGTGVLGIFSLIMGAAFITAIDIDPWACENSRENFQRNNLSPVTFEIIQGDAGSIPVRPYDMILANINRNILLSDLPVYASRLKPGGNLILSGILDSDRDAITQAAESQSFRRVASMAEQKWISLVFSI